MLPPFPDLPDGILFSPALTLLHPHRLPCCSSSSSSALLPQGLCTFHSVCSNTPCQCIASFGWTGILGSREAFLPNYFPSQDAVCAFIKLLIYIDRLICRPTDHELCEDWGWCLVCSLLCSTARCSVNTLGWEWSGGGDGSQVRLHGPLVEVLFKVRPSCRG